MSTIYQKVKRW